MKTAFLLTGLVLLLLANIVMAYTMYFPVSTADGFTNYFLANAGNATDTYKPIGPFDNLKITPNNGVSSWRSVAPNEPLLGPAFTPGPDRLFMFRDNQAKPECCDASYASDTGCVCTTPEQRNFINMRGGNRTMEDGF